MSPKLEYAGSGEALELRVRDATFLLHKVQERRKGSRMDDNEHYTAVVDARGLTCPLPLLKARQALMLLERGDSVLVLATDPEAERDFEEFCDAAGHELLGITDVDDALRIGLRKG